MQAGASNQSTRLRAMSSAGAPLEDKLAEDVALWYQRDGGAKVSLSLVDLEAADATHTDGGIIHVGDGWYRVDVPDAAAAVGVPSVLVAGTVDGGVVVSAPIPLRLDASIAAKTALIRDGSVVEIGQQDAGVRHLQFVRGEDRTVSSGDPLILSDPGYWPDVSDGDWIASSVALTIRNVQTDAVELTQAGTCYVESSTRKVRFEVASVKTALLSVGKRVGKFDVQLTLPSTAGSRTLAPPRGSYGSVSVDEDQTR